MKKMLMPFLQFFFKKLVSSYILFSLQEVGTEIEEKRSEHRAF